MQIIKGGGKRLDLEVLRIIACYFVIFNHTGDKGFFLFSTYPANSPWYWLYAFMSVFCKFSVPLFFAISGALLLPKTEEGFRTVFSKRIFKMGVILLLVSVVYWMLNSYSANTKLNLKEFLAEIYVSESDFHLWYLYAFIPFLMALPLLRPMVQGLQNKHFLYMIILCLVFTAVFPIGEYLLKNGKYVHNSNFNMGWLTSSAVIYPFVGYYIENRMDVLRAKKYLPYLWITNIVTIIISCGMTYYKATVTGVCDEGNSQEFHKVTSNN